MKLQIKKNYKTVPVFINHLLATLPFDYTAEIDVNDKHHLLNIIYDHCYDYEYIQRNTRHKFACTHSVNRIGDTIMIYNANGRLVLIFQFC